MGTLVIRWTTNGESYTNIYSDKLEFLACNTSWSQKLIGYGETMEILAYYPNLEPAEVDLDIAFTRHVVTPAYAEYKAKRKKGRKGIKDA